MNNREANQSSLRAVPKLSVIISASVTIRRREQRTHLRNNGAASSADPVASARIGSVVVPIFAVGKQTRTFSQTHPVTSFFNVPVFVRCSVQNHTYRFQQTRSWRMQSLKGHCARGFNCHMFTSSWLRQKDVPTKRLHIKSKIPRLHLQPRPCHQETAPATRTTEQKMHGRLCGQHLESKTEVSSPRCAPAHSLFGGRRKCAQRSARLVG